MNLTFEKWAGALTWKQEHRIGIKTGFVKKDGTFDISKSVDFNGAVKLARAKKLFGKTATLVEL
jgi:hypothetical protein